MGGRRGYAGLATYGYNHIQETTGLPEDASKKLPVVHRIFSNLKENLGDGA